MNRRSFFSKLAVAAAVAPSILKVTKPTKKQQIVRTNVMQGNTMWVDPRGYYGEWKFIKGGDV